MRTSHGKSYGMAVGELEVLDNLPVHLRQGLFAEPKTYPVIVRFANVPGTIESDTSQTQRDMALKILDIPGEKIAPHATQTADYYPARLGLCGTLV